jgi:hypothetical protein
MGMDQNNKEVPIFTLNASLPHKNIKKTKDCLSQLIADESGFPFLPLETFIICWMKYTFPEIYSPNLIG